MTYRIAHGILLNCYVADWMLGEFGGEWIHMYVCMCVYIYIYIYIAESLCCLPETVKTLLIGYMPI